MPGWNEYTKEAEVGTGGDWPEILDDLYNAQIKDVSTPETKPDPFNDNKPKTQFYITWELDVDDYPTLRQYVTLPPQYIENGILGDKANLFKVMVALGFDMNGRFTVAPEKWIGKEARVMVENKKNANGEMRPRIKDVMPTRSTTRTQKATPAKEPVGAGAGRGTLRERLADDEGE